MKLYHPLSSSTPGDPFEAPLGTEEYYIAKGFLRNPPSSFFNLPELPERDFEIIEVEVTPRKKKGKK